ncbi:hypothetical protein AVEN_52375-1 [Araneus ventricosus]|uniref:Uncharacterized protein n=1 Tax=Araneus ventricosus TaxID=182803 RepID=A0A4Y2Q316_ARAVE|nr:hypothetical protein AVEN_52375-1 [Araneus ventricosus]
MPISSHVSFANCSASSTRSFLLSFKKTFRLHLDSRLLEDYSKNLYPSHSAGFLKRTSLGLALRMRIKEPLSPEVTPSVWVPPGNIQSPWLPSLLGLRGGWCRRA